jgi:Apea-like HEPN
MSLSPQFIAAARKSLLQLFPIWISVPKNDFRRVTRPSGPGTYSIAIEPYRGSMTVIAFHGLLLHAPAFQMLKDAITDFQPELSHHLVIPGRAIPLKDSSMLICMWCKALETDPQLASGLESAIDRLLALLAETLSNKKLTHRITTSVSGLRLPPTNPAISLGQGVTLRVLSDDELVNFGAQDITFGKEQDLMANSVSACIEFESTFSFSLEPTLPQTLLASDTVRETINQTVSILQALHILKAGRVGIFLTRTEISPQILPQLNGGSSWPSNRYAFASMDLYEEEISTFLAIETGLREASRDELRIAADRLVDAENRPSPVDALLDAVIGLEVLLNPMDSSELAFRVALNYAFLAPPELRRERYERVRLLQKTRNRVVHGGLNSSSPDSALIHEHSTLAKECLRDVLKYFLLDESLKGNQKLDSDFWLDRVLPRIILNVPAAIS